MTNNIVTRPFAGKSQRIREQHEDFWNRETALVDVDAYFNRTPGHQYANTAKWIKETTPFTQWKRARFAESQNALLIGNRSSFDVVQYPDSPGTAGMSMIHIMAISKGNLFNGVSLDRNSVSIIDEMVDLFKTSWADPTVRQAILQHQRKAIELQAGNNHDQTYREAIEHYRELEAMINDLNEDDFTFGLHLWPDNSVGHLHMHIIATPPECRRYSTFLHDDKTKDAIEVRDYIRTRSLI
ncbi:hypothetical protein F4804DRAFT_347791 [Jackrogersella minutella]|nr:hypothetical protein F4804DRAFT_347791 [Jackrogersella minutella]